MFCALFIFQTHSRIHWMFYYNSVKIKTEEDTKNEYLIK